jgi:Spy/CpxP family protein refolding chaperone
MKRILLTALGLVALATGALTLTAFRHGGGHDPARMERFVTNRLDDLLDDVDATDAQRQEVHAIKADLLAQGKALKADHGTTRRELVALWNAPQMDGAKVHALVDARAASMKAFADHVADALVKVHGLLTPEQRAKLSKKLARHLEE